MLLKLLAIVWYENGDEIVDELNNELTNQMNTYIKE